MAEGFVDGRKTQLITDSVWRTRTQIELAIGEYVGCFNDVRLHESLDDRPPAEFETLRPSSRLCARAESRDPPYQKPGCAPAPGAG